MSFSLLFYNKINNLSFICKKIAELPHILPISAESEVFEGNIFQITCVAQSDPHPTITWLKDGSALTDPSVSVSYPSPMMSLLIIAQSQRKHAGEYTCVASNPAGQVTKSSKLKVKGFCLFMLRLRPRTSPYNVLAIVIIFHPFCHTILFELTD